MTRPEPILRRATAADSEPCFRLFWASVSDLAARFGTPWRETADELWPRFDALYAHLARIAAAWWVAEDPDDGNLLGYARSVERGGLFELSELFVRPGSQSAGIGRAMLERAFPVGRGDVRAIIATTDVRAVARYHQADTSIQFPILGINGPPAADAARGIGLEVQRIEGTEGTARVAEIERAVLGHDRGDEVAWLLEQREGYLYRYGGRPVGFGFVGAGGAGPIAALEPAHLPEILLHVEERTQRVGRAELNLDVPAPNVVAIRHLLARGFRLDPFVTFLMANRPFGRFDRFIGFSPPFIL
jgi:GNAT superfamily N-acetyltransferase